MERVLDDISFAAPDQSRRDGAIDAAYVEKHVGDLAKNADLSRFILYSYSGARGAPAGSALRDSTPAEKHSTGEAAEPRRQP